MVKFIVPGAVVQGVFGLGAEFVIQQSSELEFSGDVRPRLPTTIETTSYVLLGGSMGVEFKAGPVRIPLEFRLGYNVGFDYSASGRVDVSGAGNQRELSYIGAYQGHISIMTGVAYEYDFFF